MEIKIKIWKCEKCGHQRDTELEKCPYCKANMILQTDPDKQGTITILDESKLDIHEIIDKDTQKQRKLTKSEKDELKEKIRSDIEKFSQMQ